MIFKKPKKIDKFHSSIISSIIRQSISVSITNCGIVSFRLQVLLVELIRPESGGKLIGFLGGKNLNILQFSAIFLLKLFRKVLKSTEFVPQWLSTFLPSPTFNFFCLFSRFCSLFIWIIRKDNKVFLTKRNFPKIPEPNKTGRQVVMSLEGRLASFSVEDRQWAPVPLRVTQLLSRGGKTWRGNFSRVDFPFLLLWLRQKVLREQSANSWRRTGPLGD